MPPHYKNQEAMLAHSTALMWWKRTNAAQHAVYTQRGTTLIILTKYVYRPQAQQSRTEYKMFLMVKMVVTYTLGWKT
jgi:hypothetical protein